MKKIVLTGGLTLSIILSSTIGLADKVEGYKDLDKFYGTEISYNKGKNTKGLDKAVKYGGMSQDKANTIKEKINEKEKLIQEKKGLIEEKKKEIEKNIKDNKKIQEAKKDAIKDLKKGLIKNEDIKDFVETTKDIEKIGEITSKAIVGKLDGLIRSLENSNKFSPANQAKIDGLTRGFRAVEEMVNRYEGDHREIETKLEEYRDKLTSLEGVDTKDLVDKIDRLLNKEIKKEDVKEVVNKAKTSLKDVKKDNWYYEDVMELVELGGLSGYSDGSFRPNKEISLGEFLKLAMTSIGGKDYKGDGTDHWAKAYYDGALNMGIIKEGDFGTGKDDFNRPITREDMSYILMNINEKIQNEAREEISGEEEKIKDINNIDKDKKNQIIQAYKKGIIGGKKDGFKPKDSTTRAEAATVIMRALNKDKRLK